MSARTLVEVCTGLAAAAGLLWAASAVEWGAGPPGELTGIALVSLAGIAGVVATGGVLRRVVGVLLGVAGLVEAGLTVTAWASGSAGPYLALAGALVLVAAGVVVVLREPLLPRLGARYAAPGRRREPLDPDRQAWEDLDEGRDPTLGGASTSGPEPDPGRGDDPRA